MGRTARVAVANEVYHVINRAVGRLQIFDDDKDYELFISLLEEARFITQMRILAFTIMPNHWHLELYPREDRDLCAFMHFLTNGHTRKVHALTKTTGTGPLYQGRYKSFLIESDAHYLTVLKYIERNPVRAKLCSRVEEWRWGSAWLRLHGSGKQQELLDDGPVPLLPDYHQWINEEDRPEDIEDIRQSARKGSPFGNELWVSQMVESYQLEMTRRPPGRPKKY